jgi:hypothetical protein
VGLATNLEACPKGQVSGISKINKQAKQLKNNAAHLT